MSGIVRILKHPHDKALVLLDMPVSLNDLARQLPAQLAPDLRGWVMHNDSIPGLYRWSSVNGIHVTDDRTAAKTHSRSNAQPMPECSIEGCGQPVRVGARIVNCPACGAPWQPIVHREAETKGERTPCPSCGHEQAGKFPFCSTCGTAMVYPDPPQHQPIVRTKGDPVTVGDALATQDWLEPPDEQESA